MKEIVFVTRRIKINGQQEIVEEFVAEKQKKLCFRGWKLQWSRLVMKGRRNEEIR